MTLLADLALTPGGIFAWACVGLISGWLAGMVMSGGGYGIIRDIVLGLVGALIGGFLSGFFVAGQAGFAGSILVAFIGACVLIGLGDGVPRHSDPGVRRITSELPPSRPAREIGSSFKKRCDGLVGSQFLPGVNPVDSHVVLERAEPPVRGVGVQDRPGSPRAFWRDEKTPAKR